MSVTTFWMFATVPQDRYEATKALLEAKLSPPLSPASSEAVATWRRTGEAPARDSSQYLDFLQAFPSFDGGDVEVATVLDPEDSYLKLHVATNRDVPAALLFSGIGPARSARLPGSFGNILVSAQNVEAALVNVEEALGVDQERFREHVGQRWIGNNDESDIPRLLTVLPDALRCARDQGRGLLGFQITV